MQRNLTEGGIFRGILLFALPLMLGNLLQQLYNVADTWVVGHFLGADALAAVGSSYTLMTFLTSVISGLCMGSGAAVSMQFGRGAGEKMRRCVFMSFTLIAAVTAALHIAVYLGNDGILRLLRVPEEIQPLMRDYLLIIYAGIGATFLYNYCACLLRAVGNSTIPLLFLGVSAILNVALDVLLVTVIPWGVRGAAAATVMAQLVSGIGLAVYTLARAPEMRPKRAECVWNGEALRSVLHLSLLTCLQQSIMNFGILMVQGRINSFGATVMAAFAAAVKIDSFAYMPVQDFGNAFSTFAAQNYGAGKWDRIRRGVRSALGMTAGFCVLISAAVVLFAEQLMTIFIDPAERQIIEEGARYLRIEGACYIGIGILFLLYGYYRAVDRPMMSVVLTVISLGTRVLLAYTLSAIPAIGVAGVWISVPIGWALADLTGAGYYAFLIKRSRKNAY